MGRALWDAQELVRHMPARKTPGGRSTQWLRQARLSGAESGASGVGWVEPQDAEQQGTGAGAKGALGDMLGPGHGRVRWEFGPQLGFSKIFFYVVGGPCPIR